MIKGSGWAQAGAAVVSGLLVAGMFPPYDLAWLAWCSLVPLLWALLSVTGNGSGRRGFALGYLAGVVSCLIQFNWLETVTWLGAILFPLYLAIYWGLFGWFVTTLARPGKSYGVMASARMAFSCGAVWAGLELLRGWMLTGFSWNELGVAFQQTPLMAQSADLLGLAGISLLLVFIQVLLVRGFWPGKTGSRWEIAMAAMVVLAMAGYGKIRLGIEKSAESIRLKALLVQLNVPQEAAVQEMDDLEIHQGYEDETRSALEKLQMPNGQPGSRWPDWVIWPECALTGRILRTADGGWGQWPINQDTLDQVQAVGPFSLIYGVNENEAEAVAGGGLAQKTNGRSYNSIAVMSPQNELQTYRKQHLVIFGETIPFVDSLPFLKSLYQQQSGMEYNGGFTPGTSTAPVPILAGKTQIGAIPTVCFEDSVGRLVRKFVRDEPQVIVNVTNDGWFKDSPAALQHFATARFRAIELRRPMLRCGNNGVSAAVDSTGSTIHPNTGENQIIADAQGRVFTRGSKLVEVKVPLRPSFSLYAKIGDWGLMALAGIGLIVAPRFSLASFLARLTSGTRGRD
jgi:apolipoprotein N-acyltransferase